MRTWESGPGARIHSSLALLPGDGSVNCWCRGASHAGFSRSIAGSVTGPSPVVTIMGAYGAPRPRRVPGADRALRRRARRERRRGRRVALCGGRTPALLPSPWCDDAWACSSPAPPRWRLDAPASGIRWPSTPMPPSPRTASTAAWSSTASGRGAWASCGRPTGCGCRATPPSCSRRMESGWPRSGSRVSAWWSAARRRRTRPWWARSTRRGTAVRSASSSARPTGRRSAPTPLPARRRTPAPMRSRARARR